MEATDKTDNELMPNSGVAWLLTKQEIEDFIARNPDMETYEWLYQRIINRVRFPSTLNKIGIIDFLCQKISMLVSASENNEVDESVYRFAKQVLLLTHMLGLGSEDPDQYTLALLRKLTHLPYMMAKKNIKWNFKWLAFIIHVFKLVDNSQISLQKKISILGTFIQSPCPLFIEGLSYMQDLLPVLIDSDSNRRMPVQEAQGVKQIVIMDMLMAGVITPLQAYQLQEKKTISNNGTLIAIILIINCEHYTVSQDIYEREYQALLQGTKNLHKMHDAKIANPMQRLVHVVNYICKSNQCGVMYVLKRLPRSTRDILKDIKNLVGQITFLTSKAINMSKVSSPDVYLEIAKSIELTKCKFIEDSIVRTDAISSREQDHHTSTFDRLSLTYECLAIYIAIISKEAMQRKEEQWYSEVLEGKCKPIIKGLIKYTLSQEELFYTYYIDYLECDIGDKQRQKQYEIVSIALHRNWISVGEMINYASKGISRNRAYWISEVIYHHIKTKPEKKECIAIQIVREYTAITKQISAIDVLSLYMRQGRRDDTRDEILTREKSKDLLEGVGIILNLVYALGGITILDKYINLLKSYSQSREYRSTLIASLTQTNTLSKEISNEERSKVASTIVELSRNDEELLTIAVEYIKFQLQNLVKNIEEKNRLGRKEYPLPRLTDQIEPLVEILIIGGIKPIGCSKLEYSLTNSLYYITRYLSTKATRVIIQHILLAEQSDREARIAKIISIIKHKHIGIHETTNDAEGMDLHSAIRIATEQLENDHALLKVLPYRIILAFKYLTDVPDTQHSLSDSEQDRFTVELIWQNDLSCGPLHRRLKTQDQCWILLNKLNTQNYSLQALGGCFRGIISFSTPSFIKALISNHRMNEVTKFMFLTTLMQSKKVSGFDFASHAKQLQAGIDKINGIDFPHDNFAYSSVNDLAKYIICYIGKQTKQVEKDVVECLLKCADFMQNIQVTSWPHSEFYLDNFTPLCLAKVLKSTQVSTNDKRKLIQHYIGILFTHQLIRSLSNMRCISIRKKLESLITSEDVLACYQDQEQCGQVIVRIAIDCSMQRAEVSWDLPELKRKHYVNTLGYMRKKILQQQSTNSLTKSILENYIKCIIVTLKSLRYKAAALKQILSEIENEIIEHDLTGLVAELFITVSDNNDYMIDYISKTSAATINEIILIACRFCKHLKSEKELIYICKFINQYGRHPELFYDRPRLEACMLNNAIEKSIKKTKNESLRTFKSTEEHRDDRRQGGINFWALSAFNRSAFNLSHNHDKSDMPIPENDEEYSVEIFATYGNERQLANVRNGKLFFNRANLRNDVGVNYVNRGYIDLFQLPDGVKKLIAGFFTGPRPGMMLLAALATTGGTSQSCSSHALNNIKRAKQSDDSAQAHKKHRVVEVLSSEKRTSEQVTDNLIAKKPRS